MNQVSKVLLIPILLTGMLLIGCNPSSTSSSHEGMINYNGEWVTVQEYEQIKSGDQQQPTASPPTQPTPVSQPAPPVTQPTIDLDFTGHGDDVTATFNLPEGTFIFDMECDGDGHFAVWLVKQGVGEVELLANDIGSYSGKKSITIQENSIFNQTPGQYMLDITSESSWSISIYEQ
jgi:hypothetical protein